MQKTLFIAIFLALPLTSQGAFEVNLKYGSSGEEVRELQEFLTDQGVYSGPISGYFYSLTKNAVAAFQTKEGVTSSGFFGPLTRAKANTLLGENDAQEIAEIGFVSAPVRDTAKTDSQALLESLLAQLRLLQDQVATQTLIQDRILHTQTAPVQIPTPTTPSVTPTTPVAPSTPVVEPTPVVQVVLVEEKKIQPILVTFKTVYPGLPESFTGTVQVEDYQGDKTTLKSFDLVLGDGGSSYSLSQAVLNTYYDGNPGPFNIPIVNNRVTVPVNGNTTFLKFQVNGGKRLIGHQDFPILATVENVVLNNPLAIPEIQHTKNLSWGY